MRAHLYRKVTVAFMEV